MRRAHAHAKINLGLVVGPLRADGRHEIVTLLQRVALHDDIELEPAAELAVEGFAADTVVRAALAQLGAAAGRDPNWRVRIEKRIPVAAGLGGGSSDAATALELANEQLARPLEPHALHDIAARVGADVPFFLLDGAQLAVGDGTELTGFPLPLDYHVVLVVPSGESKRSTADVYGAFDARAGADGYGERAAAYRAALQSIATARDLARLPPNDLASSPICAELEGLGALRADVSGAGPTVYGLFERAGDARRAAEALGSRGRTFVTRPVAR